MNQLATQDQFQIQSGANVGSLETLGKMLSLDYIKAAMLSARPYTKEKDVRDADVERAATMLVLYVSQKPELLQCSQVSMLDVAVGLSSTGLWLGPPHNEAYLVQYTRTMTLQPSYKGLERLTYDTGLIEDIETHQVHKGDEFSWAYGTDAFIKHLCKTDLPRTDETISHVYTIITLKSGKKKYLVMTRNEIEVVHSVAKSEKVWGKWWGPMANKTCCRRAMKQIPQQLGSQLAVAIEYDNQHSTIDGKYADDDLEYREVKAKQLAAETAEIPDDFEMDEIVQEAKQEPTEKLLTAFRDFNVSQDMIEKNIGHPIAEITPEDILNLREAYAEIKERPSAVGDHFPKDK